MVLILAKRWVFSEPSASARCPLGLAHHVEISAGWSSEMNLFTIVGVVVVVLFVAGYFGLH